MLHFHFYTETLLSTPSSDKLVAGNWIISISAELDLIWKFYCFESQFESELATVYHLFSFCFVLQDTKVNTDLAKAFQ